ncbi:hypothetical protein PV350_34350 [Streptomyces sp. PA03-6a]|nr:hypothetical protein [Streptomyces sp. PA03-6a]
MTEDVALEHIVGVLDVPTDSAVCVSSRRFVLDGNPVLLSTSHRPADLVAGSAITREDS